MPNTTDIIHIYPTAPAKPALGRACNGCGVCCLLEPCPLGVALFGQRRGACKALRWQPDVSQYRCGAITAPGDVLKARLPRWMRGLAVPMGILLGWWAGRWIGIGIGCDCDVQVEQNQPAPAPARHASSSE